MDTLMELNIRDHICEKIRNHIELFDLFESVYLFGSILDRTKFPNDIDILLIYSKYSSRMVNNFSFIRSALEEISGMPIDLTVLSIEEEREMEFLKKINSLYLKLPFRNCVPMGNELINIHCKQQTSILLSNIKIDTCRWR